MILLVAPSAQALPAVPVPATFRRLVLRGRRATAERRLRREIDSARYDLLISMGFATAADQRLQAGDLLLATRVFGSADVYLDLPPYQAPGAVRGSLCSLPMEVELQAAPAPLVGAAHGRQRRLPPVYAFDDHAFWLAHIAQAADLPCLILRAILLPAPESGGLDPLLVAGRRFVPGALVAQLLGSPRRWAELPALLRNASQCRHQLAATLTILLMLHERPPSPQPGIAAD